MAKVGITNGMTKTKRPLFRPFVETRRLVMQAFAEVGATVFSFSDSAFRPIKFGGSRNCTCHQNELASNKEPSPGEWPEVTGCWTGVQRRESSPGRNTMTARLQPNTKTMHCQPATWSVALFM